MRHVISSVCQGLLSCRRHIGKREDPGDDVGQNADMQFTKEIEENGKIPFLVCLVILDNNRLRTTIYGKPTQFPDRLLDQSSYNPTSHRATTIRTLRRRAQLVCDSPDDLNNACSRNNNADFVRRNTHSIT